MSVNLQKTQTNELLSLGFNQDAGEERGPGPPPPGAHVRAAPQAGLPTAPIPTS